MLYGFFRICAMRRLFITIIMAMAPGVAASDYYETLYQAKTLRADKRFSEALEKIIPLATENNPNAQIILADMYFHAEGLNQDNERALYWACSAPKFCKTDSEIIKNLSHYSFSRLWRGNTFPLISAEILFDRFVQKGQ